MQTIKYGTQIPLAGEYDVIVAGCLASMAQKSNRSIRFDDKLIPTTAALDPWHRAI